jgi:hypothetical protein
MQIQTLGKKLVEISTWRVDQLRALLRGILLSPDLGQIVCSIHMADNCVDVPERFTEDVIVLTTSLDPGCSFRLLITTSCAPHVQDIPGLDDTFQDRLLQLDLRARKPENERSSPTLLDKVD